MKPFISSAGNLSANRQYRLGSSAYAGKDYISAKRDYMLAKEYDELPFRAPEMINLIIKKYTLNKPNVHLVDVMHVFELHSPHGILDSTLFLEHVHPNLKGQRLISDAFYTELKKSGLLPVLNKNAQLHSMQPEECPFTAFDSIFGQISIWL